ncbi:MAG: DUF1638 domain-containing protein [Woeseiaceae bacterium]|nr:DUF1638 domain-containing protein [Woeseiaceae bacterium]
MKKTVLLIACGALAKEIVQINRQNGWEHIRVQCLPADLHNRPEKIPAAVKAEIEKYRSEFESIFVAYADCGSGGMLDKMLAEYGVERLPGAHCYEFYTGAKAFAELADEEPGTFYLTDFLARHFDRLVKVGLGLDKHPELMPAYFGNYRRLVYLSQSPSPELVADAKAHAEFLGLEYIHKHTGLDPVTENMREQVVLWRN